MAKYVHLITFYSATGKFDEVRDTVRINDVLRKLQDKKANIVSITPVLGDASGGVAEICMIVYEAGAPVEV